MDIPHPAIASYPLRTGNAVRPLIDGIPTFRRIGEEAHVREARRDPSRRALFDRVARLGQYERFSLVGIAAQSAGGERRDVYVHAKIMLIDDKWATIGSCNLHSNSLLGAYRDECVNLGPGGRPSVSVELLREHLGQDTTYLDARAALQLYRNVARQNRLKRDAGDSDWQGMAYFLDPAAYGA
jgi:cardiolipin synthase A/B